MYVCVCSEEAEEGYGNCQATAWQKAQNTQDDILNAVWDSSPPPSLSYLMAKSFSIALRPVLLYWYAMY